MHLQSFYPVWGRADDGRNSYSQLMKMTTTWHLLKWLTLLHLQNEFLKSRILDGSIGREICSKWQLGRIAYMLNWRETVWLNSKSFSLRLVTSSPTESGWPKHQKTGASFRVLHSGECRLDDSYWMAANASSPLRRRYKHNFLTLAF
jgi:hypothetical protein